MNGFFERNIYKIFNTQGRITPRHRLATTSNRLGFYRPRGSMPLVLGINDVYGINEADPLSDDGTSYQHTRTVSHFDTYETYRILTIDFIYMYIE